MTAPHDPQSVIDCIAQIAATAPDHPALIAGDARLSYGELLAELTRIARALRGHAPAVDAGRVAVLSRHAPSGVAAVLGVLGAGLTWVPLDPRHPVARLQLQWRDVGAPPLLHAPDDGALAHAIAGDAAVAIDALGAPGGALGGIDSRALAYILYTSGSTGRPKGVMQSGANLLQHARCYAASLGLGPSDRVALVASLAVDAAVMDVFGALTSGATLCLWDLGRAGLDGFIAWLGAEAITIYHSTPTVFRLWAREAGRALPELRRVVLGGEPALRGDLELFRRVCGPAAVLVNGLGPTESTLALQAFFDRDSAPAEDVLPVGLPVAGTEVMLVDDRGQIDEREGELVLRSPFIALGYWREPALTEAAFGPDRDGGERRTYRTGDLLRRRADGQLIYLGRRDGRIKLRGVAVDTVELEAELRGCASVADAAIVVPAGAGDAGLVAFVSARTGAALDPRALRSELRARLPAAMIPSRIAVVPALPLTASGKVDRGALASLAVPERASLAPTGPLESWVARAFAELLAVDAVGGDDDFFELGGHSLLAIRLVARIREAHRIELSVADIFDAPTPAQLAARLAAATGCADDALAPIARDGDLALALAQERLFYFDRLAPGDPTYHVPVILQLSGPLDTGALRAALGDVVARHEALRATFDVVDGAPRQRIAAIAEPEFACVALASDADWLAAALEQARRPFDLARGPLVRALVFQRSASEHVVSFVAHHIAVDGWSMQQLFDEWSADYAARARGELPAAAPLDLHYPDFAAWQRRQLAGAALAELRAECRDHLRGTPVLQLASDRPRPPVRSRRGGVCAFAIPAELVDRLRRLGHDTGATLYMTLLAGFGVVLARQAAQHEFAVASPVAERGRPELARVLGNFTNTCALRLDLSGAPTVRELVARIRREAVFAFAHAAVPYDQVVADVDADRDPSREPVAQAMLIVHHGPPAQLRIAGVAEQPIEPHLGVAMFDLALTVRDGVETQAWFEYALDLFDPPTIDRMRDRLLLVLDEMARDPGRPIAELGAVPAAERRLLLCELNATERAYDLTRSVRARILASAARCPGAPALAFEDDQLSYRELLRWSQGIAGALVARGVSRAELVPVVARRGLALVPALVGVLEAGAAFVMLDPEWPVERRRRALARLRPRVVVVDDDSEWPPELPDIPRLVAGDARDAAPPSPPRPLPEPEEPIYGCFTSGSTGEPKVALIAQRGLSNRFAWMDEVFAGDATVTLQTTPQVFDSAIWQLLWPLCRGGSVVVPSAEQVLSARDIAALIERHGVTLIDFVPSVLDALLPRFAAEPDLERRMASLRDVILGGEALRPDTLRRLRRALPRIRVVNLYGPTEATIGCVAAFLDGEDDVIPIGRPIANTRVAVLDAAGQLAPLGVPGELHLTGACLGLGYLDDEAATGRAFIANPFPELAAARLYRTGDRVRQRPDGVLDFLGRCDDQLKIRGVRVEPGEIEVALRAHAGVREAHVALGRDAHGAPELRAWVAPAAPPDLLAHLRARLPATLVPSRIVACAALPRLAGGKVDRARLPVPDEPPAARAEPAEGPIEIAIHAAWQRVLGARSIDRHANFFDVGGNSLLAVRVHAELERTLDRRLSLIDLFRYPTIAALGAALGAEPSARRADQPAPRPAGVDLAVRAAALARRRHPGAATDEPG